MSIKIKLNQGPLKLKGVYVVEDFDKVNIIEFEALEEITDFDISQITQVVQGVERLNWQSPYDEKYVNKANELIGNWMDDPSPIKSGEKLIFFFHELDFEKPIRTQYGNLEISGITAAPKWVGELMEYEAP